MLNGISELLTRVFPKQYYYSPFTRTNQSVKQSKDIQNLYVVLKETADHKMWCLWFFFEYELVSH